MIEYLLTHWQAIVKAISAVLVFGFLIYCILDRKYGPKGFLHRLRKRVAYVTWVVPDFILGGLQRIILSKVGGGAFSVALAIGLVVERLSKSDSGSQLMAALPKFITATAVATAYSHLTKLAIDEYVRHKLDNKERVRGSMLQQLSRLNDFLLGQNSRDSFAVRANAVADHLASMMSLVAKGDQALSTVFFRITPNSDLKKLNLEFVAFNRVAEMSLTREYAELLATEMSTMNAEDHFLGFATEVRAATQSMYEFRYGCWIMQNLAVEEYVGKRGRKFMGIKEGSCIAYALMLPSQQNGYLVMCFSRAAFRFKGRNADDYKGPLRACASTMMAIDFPHVPRGGAPLRK